MFTRAPVAFPPDAAGDRILTVSGQEAAFVARARWLEPASLMFDQAVTDAFDQPGSPRLESFSADLNAKATLRLSVRQFQADYDQGQGAAPVVEVTVDAVLVNHADRTILAEKLFETRQRASDNRVGAIVQAYDGAVAQTVGAIRDWSAVNAPR
jgi:cholesterol transport system auxiliary component